MKYLHLFVLCILAFCSAITPAYAQNGKMIKKLLPALQMKALPDAVQARLERTVSQAAAARVFVAPRQLLPATAIHLHGKTSQLLPPVSRMAEVKYLPPFPFKEQPAVMYRGMRLPANGTELRHILRHGFEVEKSNHENFMAYDGKFYPPGTKAIFASRNPLYAVYYTTTTKPMKEPYFPIVFHMKRVGTEDIISIPHDVPASWIYQVSALLEVDGYLMWGELKLDANDQFVFLPYDD